jgi:hypothetical protein
MKPLLPNQKNTKIQTPTKHKPSKKTQKKANTKQMQKNTELRSITVAVGSYEGGLLVYQIDLKRGLHVPLFSSKDNEVKTIH